MEKFKEKYRIPSTRRPYWDYGRNAAYFITICTRNRENYFGEIVERKMTLSPIGVLATNFWLEIPDHFQFVILDEFVVMPNHIHGIIIINKRDTVETPKLGVSTLTPGVSTIPKNNNISKKWKPGTIGVIINQYKRICTKHSRMIDQDFGWQSRFYDHIIHDEKSFLQIAEYIRHNPLKWKDDTCYS